MRRILRSQRLCGAPESLRTFSAHRGCRGLTLRTQARGSIRHPTMPACLSVWIGGRTTDRRLLASTGGQIVAGNLLSMNPDRRDAIVRVNAFQWRFLQQDEVGYFPRLNGPDLRIDLESSRIVDGGGLEDLLESQSSRFELLHF